jgi:hypothetical protein
MRSKNKKRRPSRWKTKLGLPDLDHSKAAVLASLHSPESQRSYRHAIDEFVGWYCSEPRLSFNKTVVTRYRIHLEDRRLAPETTNVRLAAVRRLADEAADAGLLSPELAAGIRRVKGSKRLGVRLGNWLTAEQARSLWQLPNAGTPKSKRAEPLARECLRQIPHEIYFLGQLEISLNGQGKYTEADQVAASVRQIWKSEYKEHWIAEGSPVAESSWAMVVIFSKDYYLFGTDYFMPHLVGGDPERRHRLDRYSYSSRMTGNREVIPR